MERIICDEGVITFDGIYLTLLNKRNRAIHIEKNNSDWLFDFIMMSLEIADKQVMATRDYHIAVELSDGRKVISMKSTNISSCVAGWIPWIKLSASQTKAVKELS